jgi:cytochrome P450
MAALSRSISRTPPGPRGTLLLGTTGQLRSDPLQLYSDAASRFGDVVRLRAMPGYYWYLVTHPTGVEHVLQTNQQNYRKPDLFNKPVSLLAGNGLLTSAGDFWRRQRKLSQPAFHRQRLAGLAALMTGAAAEMADSWSARAGTGESFDVAAEMMRLTLKIVSLALVSTDLSGQAQEIGQAVRIALEHVNYRMNHLLAFPQPIPTARNRRFSSALATLDELIFRIIHDRRARSGKEAGGPDDLLSMLLSARDEETGEGMSDRQLRDEAITLILAGHETTAAALSWTWYLLSQNPDVETRLGDELHRVLAGRAPALDDLRELGYTRMVFEESMRLFPPAWGQPRQAIADDEIDGYRIPAGSVVTVSQYVTHRRPDLWEEPERFDPSRFSPERSSSRHRFAYFPFGGGARRCIGNDFAMMEAQLILATLASRYRLRLAHGHLVEPDPTFTLRPKYGVKVVAEPITPEP